MADRQWANWLGMGLLGGLLAMGSASAQPDHQPGRDHRPPPPARPQGIPEGVPPNVRPNRPPPSVPYAGQPRPFGAYPEQRRDEFRGDRERGVLAAQERYNDAILGLQQQHNAGVSSLQQQFAAGQISQDQLDAGVAEFDRQYSDAVAYQQSLLPQ